MPARRSGRARSAAFASVSFAQLARLGQSPEKGVEATDTDISPPRIILINRLCRGTENLSRARKWTKIERKVGIDDEAVKGCGWISNRFEHMLQVLFCRATGDAFIHLELSLYRYYIDN